MNPRIHRVLTLALLLTVPAPAATAQTADEIIEKSIAALGGRAAHEKIKSRRTTGKIAIEHAGRRNRRHGGSVERGA